MSPCRFASFTSLFIWLLTSISVALNPAPALTSMSPASGSSSGGTSVTLSGANFAIGATVTFGTAAAANVVVVNSNTLTATSPAHANGAVSVTVTNPDGQSSAILPLTNPGFELGSTGWALGASGTVGIITNPAQAHSGNNFAQLTSPVGGHPLLTSALTSAQYLSVNPGDIITFGGWISRVSGDGGAEWVLQATDANHANPTYLIGGNVTASAWTFTQQTYTVPAGKAFIKFYAEIVKNTVQAQANFDDAVLRRSTAGEIYIYAGAPTITSISPNMGATVGGTAVTINGSNFITGATVNFGGSAASNVNVVNSNTITATTPAQGLGTVSVTVTNPDGQISGIQPITNAGFEMGNTGWAFGGTGSWSIVTDSTQAHSGVKFVQLTSPGGGHPFLSAIVSGSSQYLAVNPGDVITYGGWAYRASGDGVVQWVLQATDSSMANPTYFVTANVTASAWTYSQQTHTVPAGKAFVRLYCEVFKNTVQAAANFDDAMLVRTVSTSSFTYITNPTLSWIGPNSGPALSGNSVRIAGAKFASGATVSIGGVQAVNVNVVSRTTITATTPAGSAGSAAVTVTNPGGLVGSPQLT